MGYWGIPVGGGAGESSVIWRWNEEDAAQFQVAFDAIGGGGAALSRVERAWGSTLRLTWPTKATGQLTTWVTIADPALRAAIAKDSADRIRYTLHFRVVGFSGTAAEWYGLGPAFLCNVLTGNDFLGLGMASQVATNSRLAKAQAGTISLSSATPGWQTTAATADGPFAVHDTQVVAKHPAASAPAFKNGMLLNSKGNIAYNYPQFVIDDAYYVAQVGAFSAAWATATLDTCGFHVLGTTGTTANQSFDFDEICVVRNVMDVRHS